MDCEVIKTKNEWDLEERVTSAGVWDVSEIIYIPHNNNPHDIYNPSAIYDASTGKYEWYMGGVYSDLMPSCYSSVPDEIGICPCVTRYPE